MKAESFKARIVKFHPISCPACGGGVLKVANVHYTRFNTPLNVYQCNKCYKKFI